MKYRHGILWVMISTSEADRRHQLMRETLPQQTQLEYQFVKITSRKGKTLKLIAGLTEIKI